MSQELRIQGVGLKTNPSAMLAQQGSLAVASNLVMDKPGIFEPRRGFGRYGSAMSAPAGALYPFGTYLIRANGTTLERDDGTATWTAYSGTYSPQGGALRFAEANKSLFMATSTGVKKLASATGTWIDAGVPRALPGTSLTPLPAGTWFTSGNQVAYRLVWGYRDSNNYVILGAPSDRLEVANSTGSATSTTLTFQVPSGIQAGWFYQLYRSPLSGGASTTASDELSQVYEGTYTSGTTITINDITPDTLKGQYLYTNANTGAGILQANEQPPMAKDLAIFRQYLLLANTQRKQNLYLTLLGTGSPAGIQSGDTITFTSTSGTFTITGGAAENTATGTFLVSNTGVPSTDVAATARSIVNVLNNYASNTTLFASYISGYSDFPGKMYFYARSFTTATVTVTMSVARVCFSPTVPTSGTAVQTSAETVQNRFYYSRLGQPEAFPLLNYFDVGSANFPILRIVALRDSVFFFKQEGVYRLVGYDPSTWQITLFDNTLNLVGENTPAVYDNQIHAMTTQGVATIADAGATIISFDIENNILPLQTLSNFNTLAWGMANGPERKYYLFVPQTGSDTTATRAWVYQANTKQWTTWETPANCGCVGNDTKNYLAWSDNYIRQERKSRTDDDIRDNTVTLNITAFSGYTATVDSVSGVSVGMILRQGSVRAEITAINTLTLTLDTSGLAWSVGVASVDEAIVVQMLYNPIVYGNPGIRKIASRFQVIYGTASTNRSKVTFRTDFSAYDETTALYPESGEAWGISAWGATAWGGNTPIQQVIRTYVPREKVRHSWIQPGFYLKDSTGRIQVEGFVINYEGMAEQMRN